MILLWSALFLFVVPADAQREAIEFFNKDKKLSTDAPEPRQIQVLDPPKAKGPGKPKTLVNEPLEKSVLWEISGNGLAKPSYLFGTIHMICNEDFVWDDRLQRAFDATDELVMEVDMDEIEKEFGNMFGTMPETRGAKEMPEASHLSDGEFERLVEEIVDMLEDIPSWREWKNTLEDMFSDESTIDYRDALIESVRLGIVRKQEGLPLLIKSPPAFRKEDISEELSWVDPPPTRSSSAQDEIPPTGEYRNASFMLECDKVVSYEGKLTIKAREKNMEISGLETIEEQLNALVTEDLPYESNFKFDRSVLEKSNPLEYLIGIYLKQDINLMLELMVLPEMGVNNIETFLFVRNENWVEKLPEMMKKSSLFIAVGAGHLPGSRGVIQLLRNKGYKVTPILK